MRCTRGVPIRGGILAVKRSFFGLTCQGPPSKSLGLQTDEGLEPPKRVCVRARLGRKMEEKVATKNAALAAA